jgi:hypothetical protein
VPRPTGANIGERIPLPEYIQTWLTEFDESSEPVDYSMISLILYTRLAERKTPADDVKATFRLLGRWSFTYGHEAAVRGIAILRQSMTAQTQRVGTLTIRIWPTSMSLHSKSGLS